VEWLGVVPGRVLEELGRARRGVVVLACDGVSYGPAARHWPGVTALASVFPSVSANAWLTAVTGVGAEVHGVPGMVFAVPGHGLVLSVTGRALADPDGPAVAATVATAPETLFERAVATGARAVAIGREIAALDGPWADAVLRGAERAAPSPLTTEPVAAATAAIEDVDRALATRPELVWAYVNLDDDQHAHGWGTAGERALSTLDRAARRWAGQGWTVVAHSDHGHVRSVPDPGLDAAWARVDTPELCALPAGGAGRTRWLHPYPGRAAEVATRLADALGDAGTVHRVEDLTDSPLLRVRLGAVVAIAASERFPVPSRWMVSEHGGTHPDELTVPYAVWAS
jgi:hypothetical protein